MIQVKNGTLELPEQVKNPIEEESIMIKKQNQVVNQRVNKQQDIKRIADILKIQKNIRAHKIRASLKDEFKKIHRRKKIIKELIDTEEGYIRDLGFIVSDFKMRMQSRGILNNEQGRKLFANVDEIRQLHDIFFSTLHHHFSNYHPYLVIFADVLNIIFYFRIYIDYLNNFPNACDMVVQLKNSKPAFASFIAQIARSPQYRFLSIEDYMVKPVQRLPKYVLLLKQLIKNTYTSHPDYQNVKKALQQFQQVNTNNNQKLSKIRNSFKLRQLETMLQLDQGIITPSTEFILEETVQIMSQQTNQVITNCVIYLLNNTIIITRRYGTLLHRNTQNFNSSIRLSRGSSFGQGFIKQKLENIVPLRYGTSIKLIKDQVFFKNSFTVQSPEGQSCTIICSNQEQLYTLNIKIKKQIDFVVEQTTNKLKSMFQGENMSHNSTFIKGISLLDRVPEVNILGTSERTDKMLKYTVYIVQVKIKMIKQKIFLRFSELLQLQKFINSQYGGKIQIKQGLVSSSWLNNHHQKTIQQRKINIQRFLQQILSKPEIIQNGWRILLRLGLSVDFYQLPKKIFENKNTDSYVKRNSSIRQSMMKKKNFKSTKKNSYRLSLFQQQKIQQQEDQQSDDESFQKIIKEQFQSQDMKKTSFISNSQQKNLCIQDILKANQIDLGHYTRTTQASTLGQNNSYNNIQNIDTKVTLEIHTPSLEFLYSLKKLEGSKSQIKNPGFNTITIKCAKLQRVQSIIHLVARQIKLKYYKDFRLLIQKQHSQRLLDDDELVHKIIGQINRTKSVIVFRKVIFIDQRIQQRQLAQDKRRLSILAGQIFNQIKMGKYRLNYQNYLKFSVLSAVVFQQFLPVNQRQKITGQIVVNLAKQAKNSIFPKYSSLSQTEEIWIQDFIKAHRIIYSKLQQIVKINQQNTQKKGSSNNQNNQYQNSEYSEYSQISNFATTNVRYLALLSIIKQVQKTEYFFGCIQFPVQINDQFKKFLESQYKNQSFLQTGMKGKGNKSTELKRTRSDLQQKSVRKLSDQENKNCWFAIKHDMVFFSSITKSTILLELKYQNIAKIQTYASAVVLHLKNMQINRIKLTTTSSYYIRQMLLYYRNYRNVLKKICVDTDLKDSIIVMTRQEMGEPLQQMDQCYL